VGPLFNRLILGFFSGQVSESRKVTATCLFPQVVIVGRRGADRIRPLIMVGAIAGPGGIRTLDNERSKTPQTALTALSYNAFSFHASSSDVPERTRTMPWEGHNELWGLLLFSCLHYCRERAVSLEVNFDVRV
jgi:hypothetical protein